MKHLLAVLLAAALYPTFACAESSETTAAVTRGNLLLEKHQESEAEKEFTQAIGVDAKCIDAWVGRAKARRWEKTEDAIADYGEALRLAPDRADLWKERGKLRAWKGDLDGGLADLGEAVKRDPDGADIRLERSKILQKKGDLTAAIAEVSSVIERKPADTKLRAVRAMLRLDAGDFAGAAGDFTEAMKGDEKSGRFQEARGIALFGAGDWKGAADDIGASLSSGPAPRGDELALMYVARIRQGKPEDADREFDANLAHLAPGNGTWSDVAFYLRGTFREEDLLEDCYTDYLPHRAVSLANASFCVALARIRAGEKASAAWWLEKALAQDVKDTGSFKFAPLARAERKRITETAAASALDQSVWGRTEKIWALLDKLGEVTKERDDAARNKALADILEASPDCVEALTTRAIYRHEADPEGAMKDLSQLLARRPGNTSALRLRRGWRIFAGDYQAALADAKEMMRLQGRMLGSHSDCGDLYFVLGDFDEARHRYEEELAQDSLDTTRDMMRVRLWIVAVKQGKGKQATEELAKTYKGVQEGLAFETNSALFAAGLIDRKAYATSVDKFMASEPHSSTHTWVHAFHLMGIRALYEGNKPDALRMFEACLKREARDWMPWIASRMEAEQLKKK
ncbi:MAG: tetratricopeptide repeat protein [Planctomycetes bacterium]|nr:tetratricopeptide repeat protein [Planctomycetota bacterium]